MSLSTRLRLAITTPNRFRKATPQILDGGFDLLLTQFDDAIITQNGLFLGLQLLPQDIGYDLLTTQSGDTILTQNDLLISLQLVEYEITTQDNFTLISQDGRVIQVGF